MAVNANAEETAVVTTSAVVENTNTDTGIEATTTINVDAETEKPYPGRPKPPVMRPGIKKDIREARKEIVSDRMENREKIMEVQKENRDERAESRTENREEMKLKREENKKTIEEKRAELKNELHQKMQARFSAMVERLTKLTERIQSRIDKLATEGKDTAAAQALLTEANTLISDASAKADTIVIVESTDEAGIAANKAAIDSIKTSMKSAQDKLKEVVAAIKAL